MPESLNARPIARPVASGLGLGALLLAGLLASGCGEAAGPDKAAKPAEVVVTTPTADEVTDYQDFTGRLEAVDSVDIRARVSGYIDEIPFKEGDPVKKGDLLFQIDPRSYQADYNQAVANYKQALADRTLQEQNAERAKRLIKSNSIGQEEYDQIMASWQKAIANVGATAASRDRAKLFLDWTRVTSPIDGRVSRRNVDPGNLVKADDTVLTTVVTEDPVYAMFDVDERTYLDLFGAASHDHAAWLTGQKVPVLMRLANEDEYTHPGTVNFLDNRVSGTTGTIRMRGVFPNPKKTLKAGLFARIRLPVAPPYRALLVPDEAVQSDQGRKYVYVVNDQNVVEYRTVKLGQAIKDLRVIKEGVAEGEKVIVSGMQRVRPKAEVKPSFQDPPKPPHASLSRLLDFNQPATVDKEPEGDKRGGPVRSGG